MKRLFSICLFILAINVYAQEFDYSVGDSWSYQYEDYSVGGGNGFVDFWTVSIQDTFYSDGHLKYLIGSQDTFYVDNGRMFFWDYHYEEYVMQFDFNSTTDYEIKYYDFIQDIEDVATVIIDSISYIYFDNDSLRVQHVNILNSGTFNGDYFMDVYEGIGPAYGGRRFQLGQALNDSGLYQWTSDLRCFTAENKTYNFVDVACDSTWLVSDVDDILQTDINIYPTPTTGQIFADDIDPIVDYQLYDMQGKLVEDGIMENRTLMIDRVGVSILKLKIDDQWIAKRILRMR